MKTFIALFLFSNLCLAHSLTRPEAWGSYSKGKLINGIDLPLEGDGFVRLYLELDHGWGTLELHDLIFKSAAFMEKNYPNRGRLQVEALSAKSGGKIKAHASHQNGLDVDLTYFRMDGREHDPVSSGQMYSDPMVIDNKISPNFDHERNWAYVKALHRYGKINRIFMDRVIKKELCQYAKSIQEYNDNIHILRSIRHVDNHHDHLHVRLQCPENSKNCVPQTEVTGGSGC